MLLKDKKQVKKESRRKPSLHKKDLEYQNTHMKRYGMKQLLPH